MGGKTRQPSALKTAALVPLLLATAVLGACSPAVRDTAHVPLDVQEYESGLVVVMVDDPTPGGASDQALLEGVLAVSGNCLTVRSTDARAPVNIILPPGTRTSAGLPLVISIEGNLLEIGDHVAFAGGFIAAEPLKDSGTGYPATCGSAEAFVAGGLEK